MWKFVTRGIRETLERRTCRTNVYSQTTQDPNNEVKSNLTDNCKSLIPNFSFCNKHICGSTKTAGAKDKEHESKWNARHSWPEALGWTSVLTLGWAMLYETCLRRRIFEKEKSNLPQASQAHASYLFGQVLNIRPKHVLPIINCVGNDTVYAQEGDRDEEWKSNKPFGPITIEEALKEATEEFANTHRLATAEFELHYGLKALEERRYKDAIKHFTAGANLSSPVSMFNLGLCYELGLGTLVDHAKAAKYYSDAAEQGHADATYNLGVFYAQGRGNLGVDLDRARSYFIKAAKLGQRQAQYALDLEKNYQSNKGERSMVLPDECENIVKHKQNNNHMNYILKKLINYNNIFNIQSQAEFREDSNQKQNTVASKNSTELLLDMLGLTEPNIMPVPVE